MYLSGLKRQGKKKTKGRWKEIIKTRAEITEMKDYRE